ncbi:sulfur carrier protein [Peptoniphilus olsenii]|uniref:Sulfur carrier protein n=1 Tax=Peptoniphilus olsenii TaxID=411570 RepID=A0ABV2JEU5_9FIRM
MVTINGKKVSLKKEVSLYSFLENNNYNPKLVVIEVDKNLVKREEYKFFQVKDNMNIEVFSFIGGG